MLERTEVALEGRPSAGIVSGPEAFAPECIGDALDRAALAWPGRVGWEFDDDYVSFAGMRESANAVARALVAASIGEGDIVAVWMPNRAEFAYVQFACAKIGAVIAAINTRSRRFELEHTLADSGARLLIMQDGFRSNDFVATLAELCPQGQRSDHGRVAAPQLPGLGLIIALPGSTRDPLALSWQAFLDGGSAVQADALAAVQARQDWRRPALLQYTSGTTSRPKGALCNHRYCLYFGVAFLRNLEIGPNDVLLNTQPVYHVGGACGAVTVPLTIGCKVVMPESYDAGRVLQLIAAKRCTLRSGTAAMYTAELSHPQFEQFDLSSLRGAWCNATPSLMNRIRERMGISSLVQVFAATEGGGTCGRIGDSWEILSTTCGRAVEGMEIKIVDPLTGHELPRGSVGEIRLRGWWMMNGYLNAPQQTAEVIDQSGWLHSGDLGEMDDVGHLKFRGRIKDMIRVGGENVSAEEVENVLIGHPDIVQAAAVSTPDSRLGEVVAAFVQKRAGSSLAEGDVVSFCGRLMANFRVPRRIIFVEDWPMTESGKIRKVDLRERLLQPGDRSMSQ